MVSAGPVEASESSALLLPMMMSSSVQKWSEKMFLMEKMARSSNVKCLHSIVKPAGGAKVLSSKKAKQQTNQPNESYKLVQLLLVQMFYLFIFKVPLNGLQCCLCLFS